MSGLEESSFISKGQGNHSLVAKKTRQTRGDWRRSQDIIKRHKCPTCPLSEGLASYRPLPTHLPTTPVAQNGSSATSNSARFLS